MAKNRLSGAARGAIRSKGLKRKYTGSFSDFMGPPNYARSVQSFHDSSFEVELRAERLRLLISSPTATAIANADESLPWGNLDLQNIVHQLDLTIPGIRLGERLRGLVPLTAQTIVDFLTRNDHLNQRTLSILQFSNVESISFCPSPLHKTGLNLCTNDIYSVFSSSRQNGFRSVTQLSFTGTRLCDSDLIHIHHLPNLSVLLLNETGISNEAVFLLVPLKATLTWLSLAVNPDINNDAVAALLLLCRLSFLSILDTAIDMDGLRKFAELAHRRKIQIELPFVCEHYFKNIHAKYFLDLHPPLVTDEKICSQLTVRALQRNLEVHASCNPAIVPSGTHSEMVCRLVDILRRRRQDGIVMEMIRRQVKLEEAHNVWD